MPGRNLEHHVKWGVTEKTSTLLVSVARKPKWILSSSHHLNILTPKSYFGTWSWADWENKGPLPPVYHIFNYEAQFCSAIKKSKTSFTRGTATKGQSWEMRCIPIRKILSFKAWLLISTLISLPMVEAHSFLESVKWHRPGTYLPRDHGTWLCGSC